jgi:hypothetical protein
MGKSVSARSVPDHLAAETVSDIDPGESKLASSSHDSGDAPDPDAAAGIGNALLLGGELL